MTAQPEPSRPRSPGRPRKPQADPERSSLAATVKHVDDDGNITRLTFVELQLLIKQRRSDESRMERERRAEVLRMVREDRAAMASFLAEEREAERAIRALWARMRVRVREPRKEPQGEGKRFTREVQRSRPRRLPTYSKDIIDALGRRGIYYRSRYVSGRKGASYVGCAKAVWRYFIRDGAFEHDAAGVPSVISNMGADALEVGAACDLLESVQRAERANAKLFTVIEVNLPHDLSPEARITALYRFCEEAFGAFDLPYAAAVHHPPEGGDQRNTHAHIMVWWRPTIRVAPYEWQVAKDLATEHDSTEMTMVQREWFADAMTWASQAEGHRRIYTGLSHAQRGLAIKPTVKIGRNLTEVHRRGERVALIERNAATIRINETILDRDRLRTDIAAVEAIRRNLHDLERLRSAPMAEVGLAPAATMRTARHVDPAIAATNTREAASVERAPQPAVRPERAKIIQPGSLPSRTTQSKARSPEVAGGPPTRRGTASTTRRPIIGRPETKRALATTDLGVAAEDRRPDDQATNQPRPAIAKPTISRPLTIDAPRRRRLLAMARVQVAFDAHHWGGAVPDWDPHTGVPGALPDRLPTIGSRGTPAGDGSMTIDGLSVMLAAPPAKMDRAATGRARVVTIATGPHESQSMPRVRSIAGTTVAPRVTLARAIDRGISPLPAGARPVSDTTIAMAPSKACDVTGTPLASLPSRSTDIVTPRMLQPPPKTAPITQASPNGGVRPPAKSKAIAGSMPVAAPAPSRTETIDGTPVAARPGLPGASAIAPRALRPPSEPTRRSRPIRSIAAFVAVETAEPIDQLYDVLSFLMRLRREREARARERREREAVEAARRSTPAPSLTGPEALPVARPETRDPRNPKRLSPALLDYLADVALHPEWLQIEGKRIRHVGGSSMFNERWKAWRGNQEVLRLVANVHRRTTGEPDDLLPEIRVQVDEAVSQRTRPAAERRPGGVVISSGGNER